jgi:hypothetical protein
MLFQMLYDPHSLQQRSQLWDGLSIGVMNTYLHLVSMLGRRYWAIVSVFLWSIMLVVAHVFNRLLASVLWQHPVSTPVI